MWGPCHCAECDRRGNRGAEEFRRFATVAGAARKVCLYDCAASLLCFWQLNRIAAGCRNRLLRRDRTLPFSQGALQSKSARRKSGDALWQTVDRYFRRASAACVRAPLHEYPHAARAYCRTCLYCFARQATSFDQSVLHLCRSCRRDLFRLLCTPISTTSKAPPSQGGDCV